MLSMLGLTSIRSLMIGWAVSGVILLVGLVLVLTGHPGVGFILFILGAIGSIIVTWGMLRLRSAAARERTPE
jgi:Flp pilus assembly protein TadB